MSSKTRRKCGWRSTKVGWTSREQGRRMPTESLRRGKHESNQGEREPKTTQQMPRMQWKPLHHQSWSRRTSTQWRWGNCSSTLHSRWRARWTKCSMPLPIRNPMTTWDHNTRSYRNHDHQNKNIFLMDAFSNVFEVTGHVTFPSFYNLSMASLLNIWPLGSIMGGLPSFIFSLVTRQIKVDSDFIVWGIFSDISTLTHTYLVESGLANRT